jgi:hypothetical protein
MKNEGIPTYNAYGHMNSSINESLIEHHSGMLFENIRKSIKIHDEIKKPLLIDVEEEVIPETPPVATPKRFTPSLVNQSK